MEFKKPWAGEIAQWLRAHWLLFKRTQVRFPTLMWQLTTIHSLLQVWGEVGGLTSLGTNYVVHIYTYRQNIHIHLINIISKSLQLLNARFLF